MIGVDFRIAGAAGEVLRLDHCLLSLDRKLVEIHDLPHIESNGLNFKPAKVTAHSAVQEEGAIKVLDSPPESFMTATAPLRDVSKEPALFTSILGLIRRTSTQLPDDVVNSVTDARKNEVEGSNADVALNVIGCNIGLARDSSLPLCQDTGTILFYVHAPVGYDQLEFEEVATEAVRKATKVGYLRQNSVDSVTGKNTGDNTGPGSPVFHFHQWREPHVDVKLILKVGD